MVMMTDVDNDMEKTRLQWPTQGLMDSYFFRQSIHNPHFPQPSFELPFSTMLMCTVVDRYSVWPVLQIVRTWMKPQFYKDSFFTGQNILWNPFSVAKSKVSQCIQSEHCV